MHRTTDSLLFAVLLVLFGTWAATAFDALAVESALFAAAGLAVGVAALAGAVLFGPAATE